MNSERNALPKNAGHPQNSKDAEEQAACVQLVYISRAVGNVSEVELAEILRKARGRNSEQGITGMLCFAYGRYMQVLEGGAAEVNALYFKIGADKRHEAIRLMKFSQAQPRTFALWSMRLIRLDQNSSAEARSLARFNRFGIFEPELWTGDECLEFLRTLARVIPAKE